MVRIALVLVGLLSGVAATPIQLSEACAKLQLNTCMPTATAINKTVGPTVSAASCCAACDQDVHCGAFTFREKDEDKVTKNTCFLHPIADVPTTQGDCTSGVLRTPAPAPANAKNVLFLISDDLRPEIFAFGEKMMKTPNLDKLANQSMVFTRAYCQQAICGPTRNSFLSGRRPQRTQSWNFINHFRQVPGGENWKSLPEYFKDHGYIALGTGKTYHPGLPPNNDEPKSWSQDRPYYSKSDGGCQNSYPEPSKNVCPDDNTDLTHFTDYANLQGTIDDLKYVAPKAKQKTGRQPFFLAYGMHKPHLPWHMPKQFWDMYSTEEIDLPTHEEAPKDMPLIAFTYEVDGMVDMSAFGETHPIPYPNSSFPGHKSNVAFPNNFTKTLRRGYYAAVSWIDHLIGEMVGALEAEGVLNDTIIALVGDHGWQLGEHNIWGKHTNFELGARVPLLIHDPSRPAGRTATIVESVDIYPTLAQLAGLPPPPDLDGDSLTPLWPGESPQDTRDLQALKQYAFSEYPRCPPDWKQPWGDITSCVHTDRTKFTSMGYSVRADGYRYTVWTPWDGDRLVGRFDVADYGRELYTHNAGADEPDFNMFAPARMTELYENVNLAYDPTYAHVVKQLHDAAVAHWSKN